jgi:hypothetical protein
VPEPAQRFLEYVFLALLYLFFLRVVRAVWVELREPRLVAATPPVAEQVAAVPTGKTKGGRRATPLKLVVVTPERGEAYDLGDELTIGRAPGCAVALATDNFVSQVHARVFRRGDEYWVEDLGSTNGTLLNGRKMSSAAPVQRGDRVQVGRTVLELRR